MDYVLSEANLALVATGQFETGEWFVFDGRNPIEPDARAIGERLSVRWSDGSGSGGGRIIPPLGEDLAAHSIVTTGREDGRGVGLIRCNKIVTSAVVRFDHAPEQRLASHFSERTGDSLVVCFLPSSDTHFRFRLFDERGHLIASGETDYGERRRQPSA